MLHEKGNRLPSRQTQQDYASVIALALERSVGGRRSTSKTLMRWTGASERTVKNWLSASHGPSGQHLIALAQHSSEIRQAIEVLVGYPCVGNGDQMQQLRELLAAAIMLLNPENSVPLNE